MDSGKVESLANTLKNSGLAASMTEAVNMAREMIGTGEKVQEDFKIRSEIINQKTQELKEQRLGIVRPEKRKEIKVEIRQKEPKIEKESIIIKNESDTSYEVIENETTLNEIMQEEAEEVYEGKDEPEITNEEISVKEINGNEQQAEVSVDISEVFDFTKRPE